MKQSKHAPEVIWTDKGSKYTLDRAGYEKDLTYVSEDHGCKMIIQPYKVETDFTRKGRPEPKAKIIEQGKWECAAASLAMLLDEKYYLVKNRMGMAGWRNDDRGASDKVIIGGARYLGYDLIEIFKEDMEPGMGPASISIPSLNYKGRYHAVTWNGEEILDPNWGKEGRLFWGCEWAPWTMNAKFGLLKLPFNLSAKERETHDKLTRAKRWDAYRKFKAGILAQVKKEAA